MSFKYKFSTHLHDDESAGNFSMHFRTDLDVSLV